MGGMVSLQGASVGTGGHNMRQVLSHPAPKDVSTTAGGVLASNLTQSHSTYTVSSQPIVMTSWFQ